MYNLLYLVLLALLSPLWLFLAWFRPQLWAKARLKLTSPLPAPLPAGPCRIWLHGASLGEVNLALRIKENLKTRQADLDFVFSTNTPSGLEALKKNAVEHCFLLPFDFAGSMRDLTQRLQPRCLILIETELWPNLISAMAQQGQIFIANARLSPKHLRLYTALRWLLTPILERIQLVQAGNLESLNAFCALGMQKERVRYLGNFKFLLPPLPQPQALKKLQQNYNLQPDEPLLVAGSIQPSEVAPLLQAFKALQHPQARLVLIPRHPEKGEECLQIIRQQGFEPTHPQVILVLEFGVLPRWYALARGVFVGGSFGARGGQNMIEPCGLGKPVALGPNTPNFSEEVAILKEAHALRVLQNEAELTDFFNFCLHKPDQAQQMGKRAQACVAQHAGAMDHFCQSLLQELTP